MRMMPALLLLLLLLGVEAGVEGSSRPLPSPGPPQGPLGPRRVRGMIRRSLRARAKSSRDTISVAGAGGSLRGGGGVAMLSEEKGQSEAGRSVARPPRQHDEMPDQ